MAFDYKHISLLSSGARVQVPWVKVTIGKYTFGVYSKTRDTLKNEKGFYLPNYDKYPNYISSLNVTKINGQVNQYTLVLTYAITPLDDPNFIEKVLSSVSSTRKIVFSYGDINQPNYIFKDEEAIITKVGSNFQMGSNIIRYTISAVSGAALNKAMNKSFPAYTSKRPSEVILEVLKNTAYGLQELFPAMLGDDVLTALIPTDDKAVEIQAKNNIAPIDYINYLVSCMLPASYTTGQQLSDTYVLTMRDDTVFDAKYINGKQLIGPYFQIRRMSNKVSSNGIYTIDVGFDNGDGTIVTNFSVSNDENYALIYGYASETETANYKEVINDMGELEPSWAPPALAKNSLYSARPNDISWWSNVTQYPIKASITVQGLIKPALLMSHIKINVIFVGGRKHISSGVYMVTKQEDIINESGYRTTLSLTKIAGDTDLTNI